MTRSAPSTFALEPSAGRAPRRSVERLVRWRLSSHRQSATPSSNNAPPAVLQARLEIRIRGSVVAIRVRTLGVHLQTDKSSDSSLYRKRVARNRPASCEQTHTPEGFSSRRRRKTAAVGSGATASYSALTE